ncbi:MAG: hypothetical protein NZ610_04435 [Candidatus Bipolaricaulota bacterium]|nr:hypothetical protein [Candidatus Bipolaricaulota bacterium]MCS7274638.1 hypothetical protein [Candidatus Bipolaricaulota bacterium]MDW8110932.1 hypothetical protein [Candidatus Bipolaricaulota bacterium]MDW8329108.1 hypothetical protein [Candidatus Bipolaricaulota bacterium]
MARGLVLVLFGILLWTFDALGQEMRIPTRITVGWLFSDLSELNAALRTRGYPELQENFFIWGGEGFIIPPGVMGAWSLRLSSWQGSVVAKRDDKLSRFVLSGSAGTLEYLLSKALPARLEVWASLRLGIGVAALTVLDHRPTSFDEALQSPASASLGRWFLLLGPGISASLPIFKFPGASSVAVALRFSVGYMLTFDNGAWDQEGRALKGPPDNFNGWIVLLALEI